MPKYWMISDRNIVIGADGMQSGFGVNRSALTFWTSDAAPPAMLDAAADLTQTTADDARHCAADLTTILSEVYDWLLVMQRAAVTNTDNACRAKVSVIAHSMGGFLLQKAANATWTRKNQPLLASLMNQVVMVAADVDNTLFDPSSCDAVDGDALSNLSYRITSLYSGRDAVLGAAAGLKHFGERRLGRNGLSNRPPAGKSNVWDVDCSSFFSPSTTGLEIHGAYFETDETLVLMRNVLKGIDRGVLTTLGLTQGTAWPPP